MKANFLEACLLSVTFLKSAKTSFPRPEIKQTLFFLKYIYSMSWNNNLLYSV